jgi:hypothetical protein
VEAVEATCKAVVAAVDVEVAAEEVEALVADEVEVVDRTQPRRNAVERLQGLPARRLLLTNACDDVTLC